MRGWATWSVLVAVLSSGCAGASGTTLASSSAPPPTVSSEKGSIAGIVWDDERKPIVGADVAMVSGGSLATKSDEAGRFTFNDLDPGRYSLFAQRLGYREATRAVVVEAGSVADVNLTLEAIAVAEPHYLSDRKDGRIGCSYFVGAVVAVSWTSCPVSPYPHSPSQTFSAADGSSWRLGELVWQPNGPLAPTELWLGEWGEGKWNARNQGVPPVLVPTDEAKTYQKGKSQWWVYAASAGTAGARIALDQPYTIYFTAFYLHDAIPEGFTARPK